MRIAVDAMGGDFAPKETVAGALLAARAHPGIEEICLVGDERAIRDELDRARDRDDRLTIRHASQVVGMDEPPAVAIRRKKDSSISRAVDLVKNGEAQAVFSAGSTGAAVAAATLKLRTLEGVDRPAIAVVMPAPEGPFVLLDAGATTDCTPEMLVQFAVMGEVYAEQILNRREPRVGLLNIGGEDLKGNDVTKQAFRRLDDAWLNFKGNVESSDLFENKADVVVCDGFVGNMVLKSSEGAVRVMTRWMREEFGRNPWRKLGAAMLMGAFRAIRRKADPAAYGGAPLLGVNGICIIGHGASSARAVSNGIRVAAESVRQNVNNRIMEGIRKASEAR